MIKCSRNTSFTINERHFLAYSEFFLSHKSKIKLI